MKSGKKKGKKINESSQKDQKPVQADPKKEERETGPAWATSDSTKIRRGEKILLEIVQHPLKKNILLSAMAVIIILMSGLLAYLIIQNILMPILVYLFFIISMTSFFMPSRYIFTEEKVVIHRIIYSKAYPWKRFRAYKTDKNGVYLSPFSNPDRFDRFRGVFMVMDKASREKLVPILEEKLGGSEGS